MEETITKQLKIKKDTERLKKLSCFFRRLKKDKWLYIFLTPVMAYFLLFKYYPMYGTIIAFKDFKFSLGITGSHWVGLEHFKRLFTSTEFYMVLRNTLGLSVLDILFGFPTAIMLSILINELSGKLYKKTVQTLLYVPHFITWVVLGGIIIELFSPSRGIINSVIKFLGHEPIFFMKSPFWWVVVYVISGIWKSAGWNTIIYLAAISNVDSQIYEAAIVDGANKWKQIWNVTIPGISSTIAIMLILRVGSLLSIGFEHVYMLQNDVVRNVSDVISVYEYRLGLQNAQYSYTTALGLFKGLVGLIMVASSNWCVRKMGEESLW